MSHRGNSIDSAVFKAVFQSNASSHIAVIMACIQNQFLED